MHGIHISEVDTAETGLTSAGLPKKVFSGEHQVGKRSKGGQKKRYTNTQRTSLKDFNIPQNPGNKLHQSVQSGIAVSEKEQTAVKLG